MSWLASESLVVTVISRTVDVAAFKVFKLILMAVRADSGVLLV